jgi:hypothetical protein
MTHLTPQRAKFPNWNPPYRVTRARFAGITRSRAAADAAVRVSRAYNKHMARGWESKSVEAQMEESETETSKPDQKISEEEKQTLLKKSNLALSRKRVLQQLEVNPNERYAEFLRRTLAALDAELAELN